MRASHRGGPGRPIRPPGPAPRESPRARGSPRGSLASAPPQNAIDPVHTSPLCEARKVTLSVPAWLGILRSTLNEPLRPPVVDEPDAATLPLSLIFQLHVWPELLLSTSPSASRRPSSFLTLSFQREPSVQDPVFTTRPSPPPPPPPPPWSSPAGSSPPWEAYAGAPSVSSADTDRAARALGRFVMATL